MVMPAKPTKRLGELLVQRKLISQGQLEQALLQQRTTGEFLGAVLVRAGAIKPEALLSTLSEQFGIPHELLNPDQINWEVVKQFPASALAGGKCFPVRADQGSVTVAIANPLDAWALSDMEKASGFRTIKPVLVLEETLQRILRTHKQRALRSIAAQLGDHGDQTH
jgi:type IV pilus assembly protein PilB